jgi:hypothetical protein
MVTNWRTSELEFDPRLQQRFFSSPECVPGSTLALGTTHSSVHWVRQTHPREECPCFLMVGGFKHCKGDTDYCNKSADCSYFLMDVKSMIRKQRHIHSYHETLSCLFVKFSVKLTYKERIVKNYEICAMVSYVNHQRVPKGTEYFHINIRSG